MSCKALSALCQESWIREGALGWTPLSAVLLTIVRGYGSRRWVEDNVAVDDNCLEVLKRAGLVAQHGHHLEVAPAVGYSPSGSA